MKNKTLLQTLTLALSCQLAHGIEQMEIQNLLENRQTYLFLIPRDLRKIIFNYWNTYTAPADENWWIRGNSLRHDAIRFHDWASRRGLENVDYPMKYLHWACEHGRSEAVTSSLDQNNNQYINSYVMLNREFATTPLYRACMNGHDHIVRLLLSRGACIDPLPNERSSNTPLWCAVRCGYRDVAGLLIDRYLELRSPGCYFPTNYLDKCGSDDLSPLCEAAGRGYEEIVQMLLGAGAQTNLTCYYNNTNPLCEAASGGHATIVAHLINAGFDIYQPSPDSEDSYTASSLMCALEGGSEQAASLLLDKHDAICHAKGYNSKAYLEQVKEEDGATPLIIAAQKGYTSIVRRLLAAGVSIQADGLIGSGENERSYTALQIAAENGHYEIVKLLLNSNADTKSIPFGIRNPLTLAAAKNHMQIARLLLLRTFSNSPSLPPGNALDLIFDPRQQHWAMQSLNDIIFHPLTAAAQSGNLEMVQLLLLEDQSSRRLFEKVLSKFAEDKNWQTLELLLNAIELSTSEISENLEIKGKQFLPPDCQSLLHLAIKLEDCEFLEYLLLRKRDYLNLSFIPHCLRSAAVEGNVNAVFILMRELLALSKGASPGSQETLRSLLDQTACYARAARDERAKDPSQSVDLLEQTIYLLEQRDLFVENTAGDNEYINALCIAAEKGYADLVRILRCNVPLNDPEIKALTDALSIAKEKNHQEVVDLLGNSIRLVKESRKPNCLVANAIIEENNNLLVNSLMVSNLELLLKVGAQTNCAEGSPLLLAVENNYIKAVELLLKVTTQPPVDSLAIEQYALYRAVQKQHEDIVRLLLRQDAVSNQIFQRILLEMARQDNYEAIRLLLRCRGISVEQALFIAAQAGDTNLVKVLLRGDSNIDQKNVDGATPLFLAACYGHLQTVKLLLALGADRNIVHSNGMIPANVAARYNHIEVANCLNPPAAPLERELSAAAAYHPE